MSHDRTAAPLPPVATLKVLSRNLDEQIRQVLLPGEAEQARVIGMKRFSNWIELMPLVVNVADLFRRAYAVVLTDRRVIVVHVSWIFKKVKGCTA